MDTSPKFLIDLEKVMAEQGLSIYGALHVGAHYAEEQSVYKAIGAKNILWIEGNPTLFDMLSDQFKDDSSTKVIQAVVSNKKYDAVFKIHNDTHTSSILEMDFIAESHPELFVSEEIKVTTTSLDELIQDNNIDLSLYNFLTLDIQGVEFEALEGFKEGLTHIDYVYVEVETKDLYVGGTNYQKIKDFMGANGFFLLTEHIRHWFWGDCLYARRK